MATLPLSAWFVRRSPADGSPFAALEPRFAHSRITSAADLREHVAEGLSLPDVVIADRWDGDLASDLDDLPRVWLDRRAADFDEIAADAADVDAVVTAAVMAVNLARANLIRDAVASAQRREFEPSRDPLPDLDDFALHFQARWSIDGVALIGAETLLRWNGLPLPPLAPEALVAAAEQRGDMRRLGDWIIRRACRHAAEWRRWIEPPRLSMNISPSQLATDGFTEVLADALDGNRLDPATIELEVPVSALPRLAERHSGVIADLYDIGVGFVLDGIGEEIIDPALLTWLPATSWKFHRALVARLPHDRLAAALVGTLVDVARTQRIQSVALGVEREEQRALLETLGCDAVQGYLFAEPLAPNEFAALLAAHAERHRSRA